MKRNRPEKQKSPRYQITLYGREFLVGPSIQIKRQFRNKWIAWGYAHCLLKLMGLKTASVDPLECDQDGIEAWRNRNKH